MPSALVTGATGYIGHHLVKALVVEKWRVSAVVRPQSDRQRLPAEVACFAVDTTAQSVADALAGSRPDVVFHLASVTRENNDPAAIDALIDANLDFGVRMLEGMVRVGCRNLVEAGTYWEFDAEGVYRPNSLYAATKHAFRALIPYYAARHQMSAVTLINYDVYGPADWRGKFLGLLAASLVVGKGIEATPGEQKMEFVHVDDVVRGFVTAAKSLFDDAAKPGLSVYRLNSEHRVTLREAVEVMERLLGRASCVTWGARAYPPTQIMEPLAAGPRLPGWKPQIHLEQGMRELLDEAIAAAQGQQGTRS